MKQQIIFIIGLVALTDICDTVSQLFLKSSINALDAPANNLKKIARFLLRLLSVPRVWVGFLFSVISLSLWLFVLSKSELNFAFSMDSMRYIMIALASVVFLKEKVGFARWMGIACVVLGIMLVVAG